MAKRKKRGRPKGSKNKKVIVLKKCCAKTISELIERECFAGLTECGCGKRFRLLSDNIVSIRSKQYRLGKDRKARLVWSVADGLF